MKHTLKINKQTGQLQWLIPPPFVASTRQVSKQRFSEIVPVPPLQFIAFRILRWCFGESGKVSDWTRSWRCLWELKILQGPAEGICHYSWNRKALLDLEREIWHTGIERIL